MAEIITCPECKRNLQVPESFHGQTVQCPECRHEFRADIHAAGVQSSPPPASAPLPPIEPVRRRRDDDFDDHEDDDGFDDIGTMHRRPNAPHRGGMILALGLVALTVFPMATFICGPMAWLMGNSDLSEIRAGRMDPSGEGLVQAGRILGMISTFLFLGVLLMWCAIFGFFMMAGAG